MFRIEIPGDPIPWMRAGYNKKTGAIYDQQPRDRKWYRSIFASIYKSEPFLGPIDLQILWLMRIPESISAKMKRDMISNYVMHTKKPDVDNLEKLLLDTMTGIIYKDDCQVVHVDKAKRYSSIPATIIKITAIQVNERRQNDLEREYEQARAEEHENYIRERQQGQVSRICDQPEGSKILIFKSHDKDESQD